MATNKIKTWLAAALMVAIVATGQGARRPVGRGTVRGPAVAATR